jgi:hypothetical protein
MCVLGDQSVRIGFQNLQDFFQLGWMTSNSAKEGTACFALETL